MGVVVRASANDPAWHPRYHIWWSERSIPSLPDGLPKWCAGARRREITRHHAISRRDAGSLACSDRMIDVGEPAWLAHRTCGRGLCFCTPCLWHALIAFLLGVLHVFLGPQAASGSEREKRSPTLARRVVCLCLRDPVRVLCVQVSGTRHVRAVQVGFSSLGAASHSDKTGKRPYSAKALHASACWRTKLRHLHAVILLCTRLPADFTAAACAFA